MTKRHRRKSPHWHRGGFRNLDKTRVRRNAFGFLKWKLRSRRAPIHGWLGQGAARVEPDHGLLRDPSVPSITWLGHASVLIRLGDITVLTDPIWGHPTGYPCRLVPQAMPLGELPHVDAVLVSHDHRDHLDAPTLRELGRRPLYGVPLGVEGFMRRRRKRRVVAFDWWEPHELDGVRITYVPAHHWSRRALASNRSLWGGFVIESPQATVYFSGDTARMPVLQEIGRRFPRIDYAILATGSYEPRWYMKDVHMSPEDAVETFVDLGARHLVPVHWGTLRLGAEPPGEAPVLLRREFIRRNLPADALRILAIGETLPVAS